MTWETATGVVLVGTLFFFIYLANTIKGNKWFHQAVKQLLILLSIWVTVLGGSVCIEFAEANTAPADVIHQFEILYMLLVYAAWIFTFLFVLYFVYEVLMAFRIDKQQKDAAILGK